MSDEAETVEEDIVYALFRGEYDDHELIAVFSTRELAELEMERLVRGPGYDRHDIQTCQMNPHVVSSRTDLTPIIYRVELSIAGDAVKVEALEKPSTFMRFVHADTHRADGARVIHVVATSRVAAIAQACLLVRETGPLWQPL